MTALDTFSDLMREESAELLSEMETALLELENNPADIGLVNRVFRAMHTLKGAANMFGFDDVGLLTHEIETVFDKVRSGLLRVDTHLLDLALRAKDIIWNLMESPEAVDRGLFVALLEGLRSMLDHSEKSADKPQDFLAAIDELAVEDTDAAPATASGAPALIPDTLEADSTRAAEPAGYLVVFKPVGMNLVTHVDPLAILDELRALGAVCVLSHADALPCLDDFEPEQAYLWWEILVPVSPGAATENQIRDAFIFVEDTSELKLEPIADLDAWLCSHRPSPELDSVCATVLPEISLAASPPQPLAVPPCVSASSPAPDTKTDVHVAAAKAKKEVHSSIRVDAYKLDDMVALVGELVIAQARLSQIVSGTHDAALLSVAEELEHLCSGLRDRTLSMRMLPIGTTFDRFRRLVRDLSQELGKEIDLVTQGADTELDKTVIEQLGDPLVHLLRNSIDHGIESPEERELAGKPKKGTIVLSAEHSGGHVLIKIFDNGHGLDRAKLSAKALERGLISDPDALSDKEIFLLIFHPGFSTAEKVTNISGRGVGMDVVKKGIDSLRGSVSIDSQLGVGTTVTVKLPLTLAIIEGLQVRSGDEYFVIPLAAVQECVELPREKRSADNKAKKIIDLRNEIVPYIRLREWFDIAGEAPDIEQIIIAGDELNRTGIVVDEVIGQQQTVIKSLGKVFKEVEEISGATIKGDGTMALILDIPFLVRKVMAEATR